jgi:hypothetical protein
VALKVDCIKNKGMLLRVVCCFYTCMTLTAW